MNAAITPPTPDNVAEMLARGDNDYHDGNDWWPSVSSAGSVVGIEITPIGTDYETKLSPVLFEAHVFAVEPAPPVASAPVELDVKVARDLVEVGTGRSIDGWTVVDDEEGEARRWVVGHTLIIRNEVGEHFAGYYDVGRTELQETEPWEDERVARFDPVERRVSVVRSVGWVTPSAKPAADAGRDGGA